MQQFKLLVIGPPCSGKSTISKALAEIFGCEHISSGDYARSIATHENAEALAVGDLSPDHLAIANWVTQEMAKRERVILDGFPRSKEQLDAFDFEKVGAVIWIDTPIGECMGRASQRQRPDDRPEVFYRRHTNFMHHTAPLMHYLSQLPGVSFLHYVDSCTGVEDTVKNLVGMLNKQFGEANV